MRKMFALIGLLASAGLLVTLAALAPACGEQQTCSSVMGHFYAQNCTVTSGGSPITQTEAVTWCDNARAQASDCGCQNQLQAVLDCLDASAEDQCDNCGTQFEDSNTCFSACT